MDKRIGKTRLQMAEDRDNEWWAFWKLKRNIRSRISFIFKRVFINKPCECEKLLGCTFFELKVHIESQFLYGMTWDNYGYWHVDHKQPVSLATNKEELIKLCHYTNLQPLWAIDNLKKSNKINYDIRTAS